MLLDTHTVVWASLEPRRLSRGARQAMDGAELAIASITWWELAWLAHHERIHIGLPLRSWLEDISQQVRTVGITPGIAEVAVGLPAPFPRDPIDRIIYATAIENVWPLVTKDEPLRRYQDARAVTVW